MENKKKSVVSKGFMISAVLIVSLFVGAILYMRSDLYLPEETRKFNALLNSDDPEAFSRYLQEEAIKKTQAGIDDLEPLATKGDTYAQAKLSRLYGRRRNEEDNKTAFMWAKKAADGGHAGAGSDLARMYECGLGTEKNIKEAIRWYTPGAEKGHVLDQYALSGIETDPKKRERWTKAVRKAMDECPSCDLPSGWCS